MTEEALAQTPASPAPAFSIRTALRFGWDETWANAGQLVLAALLVFAGTVAIAVIENAIGLNLGGTQAFAVKGHTIYEYWQSNGPFSWIFSLIVSVGITRATLAVVDGEPFRALSIFGLSRVWPYFLSALLVLIGTVLGLLLCIVPGLLFLFLSYYFNFFVVDRKEGPMKALNSSVAGVQANAGKLFLFALACLGTFILGFVACVVGLLVAYPMVTFASGYAYRHLVAPGVDALRA